MRRSSHGTDFSPTNGPPHTVHAARQNNAINGLDSRRRRDSDENTLKLSDILSNLRLSTNTLSTSADTSENSSEIQESAGLKSQAATYGSRSEVLEWLRASSNGLDAENALPDSFDDDNSWSSHIDPTGELRSHITSNSSNRWPIP